MLAAEAPVDTDMRQQIALLLESRNIKLRFFAPDPHLEDCYVVVAERDDYACDFYVPDYAFEDQQLLEGMADLIEMGLEDLKAAR